MGLTIHNNISLSCHSVRNASYLMVCLKDCDSNFLYSYFHNAETFVGGWVLRGCLSVIQERSNFATFTAFLFHIKVRNRLLFLSEEELNKFEMNKRKSLKFLCEIFFIHFGQMTNLPYLFDQNWSENSNFAWEFWQ